MSDKVNPTPAYYDKTFHGHKLDVYAILLAYGITHPAQQHAFKKILRAGKGRETLEKDIKGAIASLRRWMELEGFKEDETSTPKEGATHFLNFQELQQFKAMLSDWAVARDISPIIPGNYKIIRVGRTIIEEGTFINRCWHTRDTEIVADVILWRAL